MGSAATYDHEVETTNANSLKWRLIIMNVPPSWFEYAFCSYGFGAIALTKSCFEIFARIRYASTTCCGTGFDHTRHALCMPYQSVLPPSTISKSIYCFEFSMFLHIVDYTGHHRL